MPVYEYVCSGCNQGFELLRPIAESATPAACPLCGQTSRKKLSTFACFTSSDGVMAPVAGTGGGCAGCSAASCASCGLS